MVASSLIVAQLAAPLFGKEPAQSIIPSAARKLLFPFVEEQSPESPMVASSLVRAQLAAPFLCKGPARVSFRAQRRTCLFLFAYQGKK